MGDTMVNEFNHPQTHGTFNLSEEQAKEQDVTSVLNVKENEEPSESLLHTSSQGVDVVPWGDFLELWGAVSLMQNVTSIFWRAPGTLDVLQCAGQAHTERGGPVSLMTFKCPTRHSHILGKKKTIMIISFIYQSNVYFANLIFTEFFKKETSIYTEERLYFILFNQLFTISENHITDFNGTYDTQSTNIKHNYISLHSYLSHVNT